jgi:polyhydroxyalkanoate synthase subunit PhaC
MNATPQAPRTGPRPLPLHLLGAVTTWTSSRAALPLLKSGSLPWKPEILAAASDLRQELAVADPEALSAAVDAELQTRAETFLRGIERYRRHPYRRVVADPPVVWQEGATRLLDYGPPDGAPLLVVPSLINRAYILDLGPDKSLLRFLAATGLRPLLVDWGRPDSVERGFDLTDYIAGRLEAAAEAASALAGAPLAVIGYCMGGLLALALAQRRPALVSALALLAAPWDFHADRAGQARLLGALAEPLTRGLAVLGEVPVDILQFLFAALDPLLALRKFSRFAGLLEGSPEERDFVAVEDWLNDGVPLSLPVARDCLAGWYGANEPGRACWRVAGTPVVPMQDRIVPPASAAALVSLLPAAERLNPPLGHIGMMVAREAPSAVWQPLAQWLAHQSSHWAGSKRRRRALSKKQ